MTMTVGITGANGFIGKNLVKYLENRNYEIEDFDRYDHDLVCNSLWLHKFISSVDVVIHLAGKNKGEDLDILDVNVIGTYNVAKQCLKLNKPLIFASSDYHKIDYYKCSKEISCDILKHFGSLGLVHSSVVMPKVFGLGCKPFYNSFVSTILYSAANNKEYKHLIKNENEILELIYVGHVCEIIHKIINNKSYYNNLRYCFDYSFFISIKEIIEIIEGRLSDHKYTKVFLETLESYRE